METILREQLVRLFLQEYLKKHHLFPTVSKLLNMVSDVFALHQIDHVLGNVGGVIAYSLQMSGN